MILNLNDNKNEEVKIGGRGRGGRGGYGGQKKSKGVFAKISGRKKDFELILDIKSKLKNHHHETCKQEYQLFPQHPV